MGFTAEDMYLIFNLRDTRLCKMFSNKIRNANGLKTLIKSLITMGNPVHCKSEIY